MEIIWWLLHSPALCYHFIRSVPNGVGCSLARPMQSRNAGAACPQPILPWGWQAGDRGTHPSHLPEGLAQEHGHCLMPLAPRGSKAPT